jgi:hypothetical protein
LGDTAPHPKFDVALQRAAGKQQVSQLPSPNVADCPAVAAIPACDPSSAMIGKANHVAVVADAYRFDFIQQAELGKALVQWFALVEVIVKALQPRREAAVALQNHSANTTPAQRESACQPGNACPNDDSVEGLLHLLQAASATAFF